MTVVEKVIDGLSDNLRLILGVAGVYVIGVQTGYIGGYPATPEVPGWWDLVVLVVLGVSVVGFIVGSKLAELMPDPPGHYIVALDDTTGEGRGVWELNDAAWDNLDVPEGTLYPWKDSPEDSYEVRLYNPDTNAAVGNWEEAAPSSALLGESETSEVRDKIMELRTQYQQDAQYARAIRRRFSGILRRLDSRRARDQNAALEGHLTPSFDDESIDDVIQEAIPDEAKPAHMVDNDDDDGGDSGAAEGQGQENGEFVGFDGLDGLDGEALEPSGALLNDGGEIDE